MRASAAHIPRDNTAAVPRAAAAHRAGIPAKPHANTTCSTWVLARYMPKYSIVRRLGQEHPDPVVESTAMSSVAAPKIDWDACRLCLPREIIEQSRLSNLQLEFVLYANYRHTQELPSGERTGFLLSDGAGIGKGRQIAGLIYDNHLRGRGKALWFSASTDLAEDAGRDLLDIGAKDIPIRNLVKTPGDVVIDDIFDEGVLFSTYSTLVSSGSVGNGSRLDQIIEWCNASGAFDGVIVFDESHKAKSMNVGDDTKSTKTAIAVRDLQLLLPHARVVYVSATGASELRHLAYMTRLGLWGKGTPFEDTLAFKNAIGNRGVGAMELVAMDMKAKGLCLARTLSYEKAGFSIDYCELSSVEVTMYNNCCDLWARIRQCFDDEIRVAGAGKHEKGRQVLNALYWGCHLRFFKELCMCVKVDHLVRLAKKAVDKKYMCVVIGLQSTGEAGVSAQLEQDGFKFKFKSVCEYQLLQMVNRMKEFQTADEDIIEEMQQEIDDLGLPPNALDYLIDRLGGPSKVAEMTGRTHRIIRRRGVLVSEKRVRDINCDGDYDSVNQSERAAFQQGRKLFSIISAAASTGVSLQADRRAQNQRRRLHVTLELPWSADQAVQQLGRSHRSNQSTAPEYCLLISKIGAEQRFATAVAERLGQLGALTKGDRRATNNAKDGNSVDAFAIETDIGVAALKMLYHNVIRLAKGFNMEPVVSSEFLLAAKDTDSDADSIDAGKARAFGEEVAQGLVSLRVLTPRGKQDKTVPPHKQVARFLNRLFGFHFELQQKIMAFFQDCIDVCSNDKEFSREQGIVDVSGSNFQVTARDTLWLDSYGVPCDVSTLLNHTHPTACAVRNRLDASTP